MDEPQHPAGSEPRPEPPVPPSTPTPEPPHQAESPKPEVIKEIHHHHYERSRGLGLGRLLIGLVLVLVGLAYLGNSTGWFNVNVDFWRLWPLLIVIVGLSMLSRRSWVGWVIGSIVTLVVLGVVALALFSNVSFGTAELVRKDIAVNKSEGAEMATVAINTGAGKLDISGGSDQVVTGTFESNFAELTSTTDVSSTNQHVAITTKGKWVGFANHHNDLDLKLTSDMPVNLSIDSGASDMNLDLRTITTNQVTIDTGASSLEMHLGDRATTADVRVKAGASSVKITVPNNVGVRLHLDAGVSSKDIDSDIGPLGDNNYETGNYAVADKKIDLDLDLGVASFELNQE